MDKQSFPNRLLQEWVAIHGLPQGLSLYFYTEKFAKSFTGTHKYLWSCKRNCFLGTVKLLVPPSSIMWFNLQKYYSYKSQHVPSSAAGTAIGNMLLFRLLTLQAIKFPIRAGLQLKVAYPLRMAWSMEVFNALCCQQHCEVASLSYIGK